MNVRVCSQGPIDLPVGATILGDVIIRYDVVSLEDLTFTAMQVFHLLSLTK